MKICYIYNRGASMKINNKGFTLIELLLTIAIVSILMVSFVLVVNSTFSLTEKQAYEVLKKGIIKQSAEYVTECDNNLISCKNDYEWIKDGNNLTTSFKLGVMKKYSYFNNDEYINPITNEDISNCLIINVTKDKYSSIDVKLDDSKCQK